MALISLGVPNAGASSGQNPPTASMKPQASIGKGEGKLNLIAWEGYAQPQWVKPFEKATGCQVTTKYAGSSGEMVSLMANGGGGQYDLVSASGDADLRLIYGGDVKPVNIKLIPSWNQFRPFLKAPSFNTINGVHYGVSLQFGPNVLLYSTKAFKSAPTSWSVLYSSKYKGKITVPNNPIQIADAALYLMKTKPSLGITDPYELTQSQFTAAVNLLKAQKPLIAKYWSLASDEINLFTSGTTVAGAAWPYQTITLKAAKIAVADTIPKEGATGWADSWLLATKAPHPNCAYDWMKWASTPTVQAEQAVYFGETPANSLACPLMNKIQAGSCAGYHADQPDSYFKSILFWKTPLSTCDNGKNNCVPYSEWTTAWTQITG
ncbi:MAG: ABC transporter substrate-binding protein [Acidobacteriota bacterium]|nr:ABC transporter substrate-binding protein [Acidobacteriota bacterium]MDE3043283.1 ABC transporter substrate-binding protein [Acidobacteriota bacterium]MDE3108046.1 ABC transporter substrate-binding protein [Acidobacteriota bacterium]MDE3222730.1 ABC transporter substrate-binding protein [Acidobacteriota bacterium]